MKVLLIDDVHEVLTKGLMEAGWDVDYQPNLKKEDFIQALEISKPTGLVVRSKLNIEAEHLRRMKSLGVKWIARAGAGVDNIDVETANLLGITLIHAVGANADAVAEHMVGMLLSLRHNLYRSHNEVMQFQWNREKNRGFEIRGKTLGIIGYGHTGSKLAEKLSGFGMKILAYDKYNPIPAQHHEFKVTDLISHVRDSIVSENEFVFFDEDTVDSVKEFTSPEDKIKINKRFTHGVRGVELEELMRESDIISFHVPLTEETRGWVDDEFLESCKQGMLLLNGSRGEVVRLKSVLKYLQNNKLSGFAADVLEVEPPSKMDVDTRKVLEKLGAFSNVMFSPHIAGWTVESYRQISEYLLYKVLNNK